MTFLAYIHHWRTEMAAYIKSGLNAKMMASPDFVQPRTKEYLTLMDDLDTLYNSLNCLRNNNPYPFHHTENIRSTRKKIVDIELRCREIENSCNSEWNNYWGIK